MWIFKPIPYSQILVHKFPFGAGTDMAGEVVDVGLRVEFKVGDKVVDVLNSPLSAYFFIRYIVSTNH